MIFSENRCALFRIILLARTLIGFRRPVNSALDHAPQQTMQGTLKNPRKRARPPRTGEPFKV
jgi:hypothetical protein